MFWKNIAPFKKFFHYNLHNSVHINGHLIPLRFRASLIFCHFERSFVNIKTRLFVSFLIITCYSSGMKKMLFCAANILWPGAKLGFTLHFTVWETKYGFPSFRNKKYQEEKVSSHFYNICRDQISKVQIVTLSGVYL